jgi:alkanesulfonate monooxygenase SsuD/methylene tetrahydromethanopterin reductase-like flavin-dependent oxidoreductase (luciferase family)
MKVGVLQFFAWPDRTVPIRKVYERVLERIEIMDRSGYDAVWLAEHHFQSFSVCPSIHMMATLVAARTRRLRIGTAVSLAAFYHPLRLAEEVALLDVLSAGRVNWGAGRGFHRQEFQVFGVPPEESAARFREAVDIVLAAWRSERLTFNGRFHAFEDVEVLPKPLQQPHPPVWLAASSEDSIKGAARDGFAILMDPHSAHAEIGRKLALYHEALRAAGYDPATREVPTARLVAIGDTAARAAEVARRGARWLVDSYVNAEAMAPAGKGMFLPFGEGDPIERYMNGVIIHGTASAVADELMRLEAELPLRSLLLAPLSEETFHRFTDDVLPRLSAGT